MSNEERVSRETKLAIARELVSSYVKGNAADVRPEQLGDLFLNVYKQINEAFPEPSDRKIGLGV